MNSRNLLSLCFHLNACQVARDGLTWAGVNRDTWENHPHLKANPWHMLWFAMRLGVDPKWIAAAILWIHSVSPTLSNKEEVRAIADFSQGKIQNLPTLTGRSQLYSLFGKWVKGGVFMNSTISWALPVSVPISSAHPALLNVLTWDVIKKTLVDKGLSHYLDE